MEQWNVIGVDTMATVTIKQENKTYKGIRLYLVGEAPVGEGGRYRGQVCRDQFLTNERLQKLNVAPMPGDTVTFYFNRFGDIERIDVNG